ncbi:MAG TPA: isoprenylcysteine carboxylmethyltransferase family protein [Lacipirellulaceae bacterium]|nr:isoprenylcysteine carboxylmethyltransferase family protein [Lacipirellulaceae bacterium]
MSRPNGLNSPAVRIHPLMHVPVPWIFVLVFLGGVVVQHFVPIRIHSTHARHLIFALGTVITVAGTLLAACGLWIFLSAGTTTVPYKTASKLVTCGPYRFTRNPMYVGLILVYLGLAGIQVQIWSVLLLPLVIAYLHRIVIPVEESRLRDAFGESYQQYCARVRRWF